MTTQSGERPEEFPTPPNGLRMPVPAPPNGRSGTRSFAVFTGVAGLVAGAVLASGSWLLFGNGGPSSASVAAPERLGTYYRLADHPKTSGRDHARRMVDRQNRYDRESTARLSAAHGGAGAVVQQYASEDLETMFSLEVVRAKSPYPPYVRFTDPKDLGVDKPVEEVLEYGDVACAVRNQPNQPPVVVACVRTADDLTVSITHINNLDEVRAKDLAELVDAAWSQVS